MVVDTEAERRHFTCLWAVGQALVESVHIKRRRKKCCCIVRGSGYRSTMQSVSHTVTEPRISLNATVIFLFFLEAVDGVSSLASPPQERIIQQNNTSYCATVCCCTSTFTALTLDVNIACLLCFRHNAAV